MTAQRAAAACSGKVAFDSWALAEAASKRRRKNAGISVRPYRCKVCGKVHLGGGEPVRDVRKAQRVFAKYEVKAKE
jgi:hypothetical protein